MTELLEVPELGFCAYCGMPVVHGRAGKVLTVRRVLLGGLVVQVDEDDDYCDVMDFHSAPGPVPSAEERREDIRRLIEARGMTAEVTRIASLRVAIAMQATGLPVPEPEVVR